MHIITQEIIYTSNTLVALIGAIICIATVIVSGVYWMKHISNLTVESYIPVIWLIMFLLFIITLCLSGSASIFAVPTDKYIYTATFDDTVSMNDFHNKYEFISYEDGIYTFKDR